MSQQNHVRRIVILGGGFAGVYTARYLESQFKNSLRGEHPDVEIVLANKENYFVFQPLLPEVVSGNIGLLDTVSPIRRLLPRTKLFIREIDAIDLQDQTVTLSPGFRPRPHILRYDQLVMALGSVTDFRGIAGLYEHALPFKNLADAVHLRNHLIHVMEEACIETDAELREKLLTFVVAGGGFSGVEVCAEINDFVRQIAKQNSRHLGAARIRVCLLHSGERILQRELSQGLGEYAQDILRKRGVELLLGTRLKTASPDAAVLNNGDRIPTKTLVSTVPSSPHPLIETLDLPTERDRIVVDPFLSVDGFPNVWALGDCALVPDPRGEGYSPPTAQHAVRQAKTAAHNIGARIRGSKPKPFGFKGLGKMGSLGSHRAVASLFDRINVSGFVAWVIWRGVYWSKLPGLTRKIRVGIAWLLDVIFPAETVQLKIGGTQGISQSHYEPGDVIFRQGDLGDSLYIILEGEVEILLEKPDGRTQLLATLGAGDYFGEQALLNQRTRGATVRCRTPLNVLAMRKNDFNALATNLPDMRDGFERVMQRRMAELRDAMEQDKG